MNAYLPVAPVAPEAPVAPVNPTGPAGPGYPGSTTNCKNNTSQFKDLKARVSLAYSSSMGMTIGPLHWKLPSF